MHLHSELCFFYHPADRRDWSIQESKRYLFCHNEFCQQRMDLYSAYHRYGDDSVGHGLFCDHKNQERGEG